MAHWVYRTVDGHYVGTRKNTGRMYEARTSVALSIDEARVFNTRQAATNAGRQAGLDGNAVQLDLIDHL